MANESKQVKAHILSTCRITSRAKTVMNSMATGIPMGVTEDI